MTFAYLSSFEVSTQTGSQNLNSFRRKRVQNTLKRLPLGSKHFAHFNAIHQNAVIVKHYTMCNAMNIMGFLMHFKAPLLMACRDCSASAQLRNVAAISF